MSCPIDELDLAEAFGVTRYRVKKLTADAVSDTGPTEPATVNGFAVHSDHH